MGTEKLEYSKTLEYTCLYEAENGTRDLYLTSCGVEQCIPRKGFGPVARPDYHLHLVLFGKGTLTVGEKTFHVTGNQFFLVKAGEESYYQADEREPWYYCWISFSGKDADELIKRAGFDEGIYVRECFVDKQLLLDCCKRILENQESSDAQRIRRFGCAVEFLSYCLESEYAKPIQEPRRNINSHELYVDRALEYMHLHYDNIRIADVAELVGINRSYLTSIFKEKMGISPQQYLLKYRMTMACHLLKTTALSIQDIAHRVGYDNPLTFSKMFHNTYNCSPSHYRAEQLSEEEA